MNRKYYPFIIVAVFSFILSCIYCPFFDLYFDDKEIFKYTGFLIRRGEVPYRDFFDHKPPLIYFLNYLGALSGSWGFWLIDSLLVLYTSLRFLQLNIQYKIIFPFALPVLFNLVLRNSHISNGIGMTREYTAILLLLFFCTLFSNKKYRFYIVGLLAALVFFMQQDQLIILAPFTIYILIAGNISFVKKLSQMTAGFLCVLLPLLFYFTYNNSLYHFWEDAFLFNVKWYTAPDTKPGLLTEILALKNILYTLKFDTLFFTTALIVLIAFIKGSKTKWLLIAAALTVPLSFISEFLSGKLAIGDAFCNYYLLALAATLPIAIFVAFAFTKRKIFKNKIQQAIIISLLLFNPIISIAEHVANYHRYPQDYINSSAEIKYLDNDPPADYQLYVFNNSNYIYAYNKYKIKAPSKWIYHYFWTWYQNWDRDTQVIHSIVQELQQHRTRYIISFHKENDFKNEETLNIWENFLAASYTQIKPLHLWKLNE
ncbi:MAG: hypothetical protein H7Y86_01305 [Rhizobacter sp.]|nr:hypothetical protein [Ferruginibacter sp.]